VVTHSKNKYKEFSELLFYASYPPLLPTLCSLYVYNVTIMITSTTPHKLAEIIRDTWPGLYHLKSYNESLNKSYSIEKHNKKNDTLV
jgi:hypothetical protein